MMRSTAGSRSSASTVEIPISPVGPVTATANPAIWSASPFRRRKTAKPQFTAPPWRARSRGLLQHTTDLARPDAVGAQPEQPAGRLVGEPEGHPDAVRPAVAQPDVRAGSPPRC